MRSSISSTAHAVLTFAGLTMMPCVGAASLAAQQQPAQSRSFVVTQGADTLATERIARTSNHAEVDFAIKGLGQLHVMSMTLTPDALVTSIEIVTWAAGATKEGAPLQYLRARFAGDSVLIATTRASSAERHVASQRGAVPFLNLSAVTMEQILLRARALGGDSARVPVFVMAGGTTAMATVRWIGADSAVVSLTGVELRAHVSKSGWLLGATVPLQHVNFALAGSSHDAMSPVSAASSPVRIVSHDSEPDYSAPAGAPYVAENVRLPNPRASIELAGTLTMPVHAAGTRVPAVVMITGSGPEDRDEATPALPGWRPFRQIADTLGRRGIAVLRLDDRGVGGTSHGPANPTSADFADDIRAALAYLRTRSDVDGAKLALVGHSEGGMIAPMIAATDSALHAIVLIAGPSRTGRAVSDQQVRSALVSRGFSGAALDSVIAANEPVREAQVRANAWLDFWFNHDPIPTAKRVRTPVLLVQGGTDTQVTPDQAEELASAFRAGGNRDVTVRIVPGVNHLLVADVSGAFSDYGKLASFSVSPVVLGTIADWLSAHLH
jgi:pimeloyl-ACP methyl ester carboxylesterase